MQVSDFCAHICHLCLHVAKLYITSLLHNYQHGLTYEWHSKALSKSIGNVDCGLSDAFGDKERGWYYEAIELSLAGSVINSSCKGGLGYQGKECGGTIGAAWWMESATTDCMLEVPINDAILLHTRLHSEYDSRLDILVSVVWGRVSLVFLLFLY